MFNAKDVGQTFTTQILAKPRTRSLHKLPFSFCSKHKKHHDYVNNGVNSRLTGEN